MQQSGKMTVTGRIGPYSGRPHSEFEDGPTSCKLCCRTSSFPMSCNGFTGSNTFPSQQLRCWPEDLQSVRELFTMLCPPKEAFIQARWPDENWSVQVLSAAVRLLDVPDFQKVTIDQEISNYHMNLAACERLLGQPIPVAYTRHTSRYSLFGEGCLLLWWLLSTALNYRRTLARIIQRF